MKKNLLILLALPMLLVGCTVSHPTIPTSESGSQGESSSDGSSHGGSGDWSSVEDDEDDDCPLESVSLDKSELLIQKTKRSSSLLVTFVPSTVDDAYKDGVWSSSNESIASVDEYGRVTGVAKGDAYVFYTTNLGHRRARCHVYVYETEGQLTKEWNKVDDMDSIVPGDTIIFGCPQFGVVATLDRLSGYLKAKTATFNSNGSKITNIGEAGTYYCGEGTYGALTLENQEGDYLAGKWTSKNGGLVFVHSKGQINWMFERTENTGLDYCYNNDILVDQWLMFNKVNSDDIRFNLYDSNETSLMKLPTIYRYTVTFNV